MDKLVESRRKRYKDVMEKEVRLCYSISKALAAYDPDRTFSEHYHNTNSIRDRTRSLNEQIIRYVIKCILMPQNKMTINHWIIEIAERWIVPLSQTAKEHGVRKFTYRWFFDQYNRPYTGYNEKELKMLVYKIKNEKEKGNLKYPGLTYKDSDIYLISETLLNIDETLESTYKKTKKVLNYGQVRKIVSNCLP